MSESPPDLLWAATTHIDASSDIEAKTVIYPIQITKYPQTSPASPPLSKPKMLDLVMVLVMCSRCFIWGIYERTISQVLIAVQENPRIEMNRKFRCECKRFVVSRRNQSLSSRLVVASSQVFPYPVYRHHFLLRMPSWFPFHNHCQVGY